MICKINGNEYDLTNAYLKAEFNKQNRMEVLLEIKQLIRGLELKHYKELTDYIFENETVPSEYQLNSRMQIHQNISAVKPKIITCPACNKQVSNQAPSCPHCGQPIDTRPKCPTCGSPDIKKMSHIKKSASIWFWGLTSDKINKTWQCNKCGQTW